MRCDGGSNVTDDNLEHSARTISLRIQMEEGTVKLAQRGQFEDASNWILQIAVGDSSEIVLNSKHPSKQ
jgi:frataxin-like iron-binding protein CyaY